MNTQGTTVAGHLRQRRPPRRSSSSTAGQTSDGLHWYLDRQSASTKTAGATTRPRTSGSCSASSAGSARGTTSALTLAYANNSLTGNGLQEQRFLARDYASVYTKPDITDNRSTFLNLTDAPQHRRAAVVLRQRLLPRHPHEHAQRRHQRRLARPVDLPAERRRTRGARGRRLHRRSRPAAPTPATRRFPPGAASATCCSRTSPARSATA